VHSRLNIDERNSYNNYHCRIFSGRPAPKVTWWRGGTLIDNSFKVISKDGAVQNKMTVNTLTRVDIHAIFTCQASNNNMSQPVSTTVQVEMYCELTKLHFCLAWTETDSATSSLFLFSWVIMCVFYHTNQHKQDLLFLEALKLSIML